MNFVPLQQAVLLVFIISCTTLERAAAAGVSPEAPGVLVARSGDRSVLLHWRTNEMAAATRFNVYRSAPHDSFSRLNKQPLAAPYYADLSVSNTVSYTYAVRAVGSTGQETANSSIAHARPRAFQNDDEFLDYLQQTAFDYFWREANPRNGLVADRAPKAAPSSIAAIGFGLTAMGIGIDHGWITREEAAARTLVTLRTFAEGPQGAGASGVIGYKGWFYHFLEMDTALRAWKCELSSIDTALLLAGILYAREYFDSAHPEERQIRALATRIFDGVDWHWMANQGNALTMGWHPESGFIRRRWIGYNEASILYLMGLGASHSPLPASQWKSWTSGYDWRTNYGLAFVHFAPLFGHQYSHCWIDFRGQADDFFRRKGITYFENSRRATLAQREYAIQNPPRYPGYSSNLWGWTASDGPGFAPYQAYAARGVPPVENDDGTIAPTAPGGSFPFTPEYSLSALRHLYDVYREKMWTVYGFRDAFNLQAQWFDPDVLGIDQGPMLIMIENHRTGRVWKLFMRAPEIRRGLERAGFKPVPSEVFTP